MEHRHWASAACGLLVLSIGDAAFAQQAMLVFGGGYARDCYEAAKDHAPATKAIAVCDIALDEEDLSRSNRAATHVNRGIVYMRERNFDRAMKDYDRALSIAPGMPEVRINQGAMLYHMGRFSEAVDALDAGLAAEDPEHRAAAYYNRALAHERLGDIEGAYDDYQAALEAVPGYAPAVRQLSRFRVAPAGQAGS